MEDPLHVWWQSSHVTKGWQARQLAGNNLTSEGYVESYFMRALCGAPGF